MDNMNKVIDFLFNEPLTFDEKKKFLLNEFDKCYLKGVDKGSDLERRNKSIIDFKTKTRHKKELDSILDAINEPIADYIEKRKYYKKKD